MILKALTGIVSWLLASQPVKALSGMLAAAALRPKPNRISPKPTAPAQAENPPKPNRISPKPTTPAQAENPPKPKRRPSKPAAQTENPQIAAIAQRIAEMMPDGWRCLVVGTPEPQERLTMMRLRVWSPVGREWGYEYGVSDLEVAAGRGQVWSLVERKLKDAATEIIRNEQPDLRDGPIQNHPCGYPDLVPAYGQYGRYYAEYPRVAPMTMSMTLRP